MKDYSKELTSEQKTVKIFTDHLNKQIEKLELENKALKKQLSLYGVRHSTSRKGTGWYMIFITALCGLLGGVGWYHLGIEVGIFTLLILIVMFLASIRYNQ